MDLLRFPIDSAFCTEPKWAARWWSHGRTKRMRSISRGKLLTAIAEDGFNELEITCKADVSIQGSDIRLYEALFNLYPSRTCELWTPVPSVELKNHADELQRMNFGSGIDLAEEYRRKYKEPYPSIADYDLRIDVNSELDDLTLQRRFVEFLRDNMPGSLIDQEIFGYGCVHGDCRIQSMTSSMGGVAAWTDQLGTKFENIYPILIGPKRACEGLAHTIGKDGSLIEIAEKAPSAMLSIRPDKVEEIRYNPAVRDWVIIRDMKDLSASPEVADKIYHSDLRLPWLAPFVKR
jgi:hypothetical protein